MNRENLFSLCLLKLDLNPLCVCIMKKAEHGIKLDYYGETVSKSGNERSYRQKSQVFCFSIRALDFRMGLARNVRDAPLPQNVKFAWIRSGLATK